MMKLVVLSCLMAAASASALLAPFSPLVYGAPLLTPYAYNYNNNYRGPLSLAPGQPANILAADGRPLDTLDVNLDRSAHFLAKSYNNGVHLLKKRSVAVAPLIAPYATGHLALTHQHLITPAAPITRFAPISHISPIAPFSHFATPWSTYY